MDDKTVKIESREQLKDLLAGTMAGLFSKLIEHPMDTLKVRLQTTPELYGNSARKCLQVMTAKEGWTSMFRGLPAPLFGAMAENSIIFWSYGLTARLLSNGKPKSELSLSQIGFSGFVSGFAVGTWLCPVEYVKCRLQVQLSAGGPYASAFDCFLATLAKPGGIRAMFSGYGPTLVRDMPGHVVYFMVYESIIRWFSTVKGQKPSNWAILAAGGSAGVAYWSSMYPFDLVKSRIQTSDIAVSVRTVFVQEYKKGGLAGLYRGMGITIPRALISNGVIFFAYEYSKIFLDSLF